jgi:hypothetical protein
MASHQVISHWYKSLDILSASSVDFYKAIEIAIESRALHDIQISRVFWREGGLLSDDREYLRVKRRRLIFDICAAPFGNGFFVSWWLAANIPSAVGAAIALFVITLASFVFFLSYFGLETGAFLWLTALAGGLGLIGTAANQGAEWVDPILEIPGLGTLLKALFQPVTYYRIDTMLMFQQAIHASVLEVVDGNIYAQGIRPLTEFERKPIMKEFFQR